ncbi:MAG: quinone-dependent dihydroorotate dehydrogenase [Flavobacteriales bacterium]|jgi:dihydroorotate dehydrogenase|nr:quinone-dependent dihydroorotate dehydrogenase [Flavobacteriales bacterium]
MYQSLVKPFLFKKDAEEAHHQICNLMKNGLKVPFVKPILRAQYQFDHPKLEREVFGIKFPNPVGMAAGFDKDAKMITELDCLGFGFVEIGTLTPKPQEGNPKPRLFRLPKDKGLINRMGFNNGGVDDAIDRLKKKGNVIVGGNIGKNKVTPNENAIDDYLYSFDKLYDHVDYFVVNVSSPNTPNLRDLQDKEPLTKLLVTLQERRKNYEVRKPILLKIAPDLTNGQLDDIVQIVSEIKLDGLIATNTTISREGLVSTEKEISEIGMGGLSGAPLRARSTEVIRYLADRLQGQVPIIGVGGIHTPEDALEKLQAGASLIQVYSGFIYEGPKFIKKINQYLAEKL